MKRIHLSFKRAFTTKFIVGASLGISFFGMFIILGVGLNQIRIESNQSNQKSTQNEQGIAQNFIEQLPVTVEQTLGGDGGTPTINMQTTPDTIAPNSSATLSWEVTSAETCVASDGWSGTKNAIGNQNTGELTSTTRYALTCTNQAGSTTIETIVTVDPALTVVAQPTAGDASNTTTTPPAAAGSSGNTSGGGSSGSGGGGSSGGSGGSSGSTDVAPVVTLSISPGTIMAGSNATIGWTINATTSPTPACTASGAWSGSRASSGSQLVSPGSGNHTYSLSCTNSAGTSAKSVNLTVNAQSTCGTGGSCSSADVAAHNTSNDCWVIIRYTANGGNSSNGQVFKIASSFFGGSGAHNALRSAPSLNASSWCGKNISNAFNSNHSGGSRSDNGNSAIWWLTNNGNSLIGTYSGS